MGDFEMIFAISIYDNRKDGTIRHAANFLLNKNVGVWIRLLTQNDFLNKDVLNYNFPDLEERTVADLFNGDDGNWADLMKQSVDDTVRNMFRELIWMKDLPESPDDLFQGDFSF